MSSTLSLDSRLNKELICIELPCIVKSKETALKILGGSDNVKKSYLSESRNASVMQCCFPSDDPLRTPLSGERVNSPGILIRIRRRKDGKQIGSNMCSVEILGIVRQRIRFHSPSDFQVE